MKEQTRFPYFLRRRTVCLIQLIGVFANPTAETQDSGECDINDVESNTSCSQTIEAPNEQIETDDDITSDSGLSPFKISQVMATYRDFDRREEDEKVKPIQRDDFLSEQPICSKTFGCPGPPLTSLMDDLDEVILEGQAPLPPGRVKPEKKTQVNSEQNNSIDSGIPSMSTLSQDDMTLDAEMGRPPMITAAGRALQRQQQERQTMDDQEVKHRLRQPDDPYMDRANVSNRVCLDEEMKQDSPQRKGEEDIMDFIKQLAKGLNQPTPKVKLFDAAILYDKNDYEDVKIFMSEIQMIAKKELQEDIRIELFDSEEFAQSQVMVVADVVERCSVVFVYITNNANTDFFNFFCDEAVGMSRLGLNSLGSPTGFQVKDRRWMLKPVHTKPIKKRDYKTPVGLLTLAGVEWYDWPQVYVRDRIRSILNTAIIRRKNAESEKNITLSYEHVFPKEDGTFQRNNISSSFPQFQPRSSNESVDAFSLHLTQQNVLGRAGFSRIKQSPPTNVMLHHLPHSPSRHLNHANYTQQSFSQQNQRLNQQQQYFDQRHPFPNYGVNQGYQYALNPYPSQIFAPPPPPPLQPGFGPPPPYQSSIMQDQLSYMYPYNTQNFVGQRGYTVLPSTSNISTVQHSENVSGHIQNQASTRPDHKHNSRDHHQKTNGQSKYPSAVEKNPVRHNSAAFGSLMRDQKDDTPPSHELNVVSRLTGKLITNPNLSNDDLEIDTGEKQRKIPVRSRYDKEKSGGDIIDTSDDSGSSSNDDDDEGTDIGNLFTGKGKIVNIIGSGVVQLGKHNKAVERYRTKRVYQGIPKGKLGKKSYKKEADGGMAPCDTGRFADSSENKIVDQEPDQTATTMPGQLTARDSKLRPDYNYEYQNYPSSVKHNQSKPVEDTHTLSGSNIEDRVYIGIQPYNRQNNGPTLSNSDGQTSILLNNLDEGRNLLQSRNETSQTKTYHNENPYRQQRNHEQISHRDSLRLSHGDNFSIQNVSSPGQEFDDTKRLISIDDNTYEPAENEILNDEELFVAGSSNTGVQDRAKFLFSSFRTSLFSKPSSMSSNMNTEEVTSENTDVD